MSISEVWPHVQTKIEVYVEILLRLIFFWERDSKRLGTLIRLLHHSVMYCLAISLFLVHTLLPSYWLFVLIYGIIGLIWIQHIICGGCVVNRIEKTLLGDTKGFVDPFLEAFHMPVTDETTRGVTIMGSTLVMVLLTLELTSRTILNINYYMSYLRL
jgi:hypothetical protein